MALAAAVAGLLGVPAAGAGGQPDPLLAQARLQGSFLLHGTVTQAVGIPGERRGQRVTRHWEFSSPCSGPCPRVGLVHHRAGGTDRVLLHRLASGEYRGGARFLVPVRCGRRLLRRGEIEPFTITVRVTAARPTPVGVVASAITARFRGGPRINQTHCVAVAGREAATFQGTLQG